ncbi:MAG: gamma carbonic anhydrase family protein [Betaproteobacteria bacterium]|nr:gamma carbonic anhydrase family protein [Betaproteobacteria bacterium]MDE2622088.1 gamma carbonic anhydrase family protein [Betaproteobacteria bacterium]
MIYELSGNAPVIDASCYVDPTAMVVGQVRLGAQSSVWCNAVLRGDNDLIAIGERCNIQDGAVLHNDPGIPLNIGNDVSVGHMAMLHGCTVGDGSLVGIKAVVLNGAVIGKNCLIGANTLITENKVIPEGSLVVGSPGRILRTLSQDEIAALKANADSYVERAQRFRRELRPLPWPDSE